MCVFSLSALCGGGFNTAPYNSLKREELVTLSVTMATGTAQTVTGAAVTPLAPAAGDYSYLVDDPGMAILKNVSAALDQPSTIKYGVSPAPDMFKNSEATPITGQRLDGLNILVQVNEVWKVTDTDLGIRYLPVSGHMVLKVPIDEQVTAAAVAALGNRVIGATVRGISGTVSDGLDLLLHGVTRIPDAPAT